MLIAMVSIVSCPQPEQVDERKWSIGLDKTEYNLFTPAGADFTAPDDLKIRVTNTGNQPMGAMDVIITNDEYEMFKLSTDELPALRPGETTSFKVSFPAGDPGGTVYYAVDIVMGNKDATKRLPIRYGIISGVEAAADMSFTPVHIGEPMLQAGGTGTVTTTDPDKADKPWLSIPADVAAIDSKTGAITLLRTGEAIIGFLVSENPFVIKGKKVTVHPAGVISPKLTLTNGAGNGEINYSWTSAYPSDNVTYTLYYKEGTVIAADGSDGLSIPLSAASGTLSGLTGGRVYSAIVKADRGGETVYSDVRQKTVYPLPNFSMAFNVLPLLSG